MKATQRYIRKHFTIFFGTAEAKVAFSYLAAYLTAFAIVSIFYHIGLFGVGSILKESIGGILVTFVLSLIY